MSASPGAPPGALLRGLQGSLPLQSSLIEKITVKRGVSLGEVTAAADHHRQGRVKQLPPIIVGLEGALPPTAKTRDKPRQQTTRRQQVAERADVRPGVDQSAQADLGVVADEATDFAQSGGDYLTVDAG